MDIHQRKIQVAKASVISNSLLVLLKVVVGLAIGSVSVISEAIHSGMDLMAATIALVAVRMVSRPADRKHPFGHGKMENLSGTIEALLIFVAAGWIVVVAARKLLHPEPLGATGWGVAVMSVSTVVNWAISRRLFAVGRASQSVALQADAWHLRADIYTSLGVLGSLALIGVGRRWWPGVPLDWIDPVAAIGIALLIVKAAYELTLQSARDLLDISLPPEEERWLETYLAGFLPTVRGVHHLRTRKAGADRFVEFHLLVDPAMSVEAAHNITEVLTRGIRERLPDASVTIHVEPCNGTCTPNCVAHCLLPEPERRAIQAAHAARQPMVTGQ